MASVQISSSPGYWMGKVDKITIDGYAIENIEVIFDSGTSLITMSSKDFNDLHQELSKKLVCPVESTLIGCLCGGSIRVPEMVVMIGSTPLVVPSERLWMNDTGTCILLVKVIEEDF